MTRFPAALAAGLLGLALALPAAAQLKAPGQSAPPGLGAPSGRSPGPAAPGPAAPAATAPGPAASAPGMSATEEKENAARIAAAGWLTLLDRRDWGTAWESSAPAFRQSVPLARWMDAVPKVRADLGPLQERTPANSAFKERIEGMPAGEYVTVVFVSKFAQRELEEVVTAVRGSDGRWRVTGYSPR